MGKAWMWQVPYFQEGDIPSNSNCPLCGEHDSARHILGRCSYPEMKIMHIHRHDEAARIMINAINKGHHGSFFLIADVGNATTLADPGVHLKRIPTWFLPDSMLPSHREDPSRTRDKMRPDVMMVELTHEEQRMYSHARDAVLSNLLTHTGHNCKRRKVRILEVGYSSNTKYEEKFQEKTLQHQALVNTLTQWGYDASPYSGRGDAWYLAMAHDT